MKISQKQSDRFWEKVNIKTDNECWEWQASIKPQGYGQLTINSNLFYAHRISWFLSNGKIPDKIQVNHHCDNRKCVNPKHLYLGTQKDNIQDKYNRNRQVHWHPKGEKHPMVKLTESQVKEIRRLYSAKNYTFVKLGKQFNINPTHIRRIVNYVSWKHI